MKRSSGPGQPSRLVPRRTKVSGGSSASPGAPNGPAGAGLSSSSRRFAARAARARRRPWLLLASILVGALAVGGIVWAVGFSHLLDVRTVTVTGATESERDAIAEAAAVPMERPLIRVDTGGIAERIRTARKPVKTVTVTRQYPHTIAITVTLRTPALVLKDPEAHLEVVDEEGIAFATVPEPLPGIPVVTGLGAASGPQALQAPLAALKAFPPARRAQIGDMTVSSAGMVTFTLDKTSIVWGMSGDEAKKLATVELLLAQQPRPSRIDVSAPDAPAVR